MYIYYIYIYIYIYVCILYPAPDSRVHAVVPALLLALQPPDSQPHCPLLVALQTRHHPRPSAHPPKTKTKGEGIRVNPNPLTLSHGRRVCAREARDCARRVLSLYFRSADSPPPAPQCSPKLNKENKDTQPD